MTKLQDYSKEVEEEVWKPGMTMGRGSPADSKGVKRGSQISFELSTLIPINRHLMREDRNKRFSMWLENLIVTHPMMETALLRVVRGVFICC